MIDQQPLMLQFEIAKDQRLEKSQISLQKSIDLGVARKFMPLSCLHLSK